MMLAEKVYNLSSFNRQYEALLILSVCETIPNLVWDRDKSDLLSQIDWNNMLSIASLFSYCNESKYLDAALRIAQTCLVQEETNENQKNAAAFILDNLTNKPALKIALDKQFIKKDFRDNYPFALRLQQSKSDIEHSIIVNDEVFLLNRFQKEVYYAYKHNETISISAPTSAGKSYILCTLLLEELTEGNKNIVYVVPTRALISQVEADLKALLRQYNLENQTNITTVPPQEDILDKKSNVFIFTQERLHWFLYGNSNCKIDILIIDEAQKIEDGNRGILLQQKIEDVVKANPEIKVFFSSPFTSNPEILLDNVINNSRKSKVNTQYIAVNQNLLYVSQVPRKIREWQIHLCTVKNTILLGKIVMTDRPTTELHKIVHTAYQISNRGGCLIYSNGAADAEDTANLLYDLLPECEQDSEIKELVKLVQSTIHTQYVLAKVLSKGIAFHYGNMPLLIRNEIERLFSIGKIEYLICTSTLLEGVNLPAKSIIIRKPSRGRGNPLNQNDFWNLFAEDIKRQILICTPEKLSYVLHHDPFFLSAIDLFVFDEGHMFDDGGRGATYELLVTHIRQNITSEQQLVLLSAVLPNSGDIAQWLFEDRGCLATDDSIVSTPKSIGFSSTQRDIHFFSDDKSNEDYYIPRILRVEQLKKLPRERSNKYFPDLSLSTDVAIYNAIKLCHNGGVAIYLGQQRSMKTVFERIINLDKRNYDLKALKDNTNQAELSKIKGFIESYYGSEHYYTKAAELGVLPHSSNLQNGVKLVVEHALKNKYVSCVVCTSTLAQGVNIPIKYLLVTSIRNGLKLVKARDFQNLMGRTARAGIYTACK